MLTGMWGLLGKLWLFRLHGLVSTSVSRLGPRRALQFLGLVHRAPSRTGCVLYPDGTFIWSCPTIPQPWVTSFLLCRFASQLYSVPLSLSVPVWTQSPTLSLQHYSPLSEAPAAAKCGSSGLEAPQCLCLGCGLPELHSHLDPGPHLLVYQVSPTLSYHGLKAVALLGVVRRSQRRSSLSSQQFPREK